MKTKYFYRFPIKRHSKLSEIIRCFKDTRMHRYAVKLIVRSNVYSRYNARVGELGFFIDAASSTHLPPTVVRINVRVFEMPPNDVTACGAAIRPKRIDFSKCAKRRITFTRSFGGDRVSGFIKTRSAARRVSTFNFYFFRPSPPVLSDNTIPAERFKS